MGAGLVAVGGRHSRSPGGGSLAAASSPAPASPAAIRRRGHRCCGQGLFSGAPSPPGSLRARSPLAFRPGESLGLGFGRFPWPGGIWFGDRERKPGRRARGCRWHKGLCEEVTASLAHSPGRAWGSSRVRKAGPTELGSSRHLWGPGEAVGTSPKSCPCSAPRPQSQTSTPGPCSGFKCPFPASL